ncbi:hypothetical protein CW304_10550 [Bacillus sp. UFRGS-B20]|nr:hypothetical protein CW304_10550 [Bacillus sp. UFRGS-B20]
MLQWRCHPLLLCQAILCINRNFIFNVNSLSSLLVYSFSTTIAVTHLFLNLQITHCLMPSDTNELTFIYWIHIFCTE